MVLVEADENRSIESDLRRGSRRGSRLSQQVDQGNIIEKGKKRNRSGPGSSEAAEHKSKKGSRLIKEVDQGNILEKGVKRNNRK